MGLYESMRSDPVSDLALRPALCCDMQETVRGSIEKMRATGLGCITIVDEADRPKGVLTEAMLRHMLTESRDCLDQPIVDHMATAFPWVRLSDPVETVLDGMEMRNIRFVIVLGDDGRVAGTTGQKGLMEYVAEYFPGEVMVQRIGSKGHPNTREGA